MSFLLITFQSAGEYESLCRELDNLECFQVMNNWHEYRLANAQQSGLDPNSAPVMSIVDDRYRSGDSLYVSITLTDGTEVFGQLRKTGLLVSNDSVDSETLATDSHIGDVVSCLKRCTDVTSVEIQQ